MRSGDLERGRLVGSAECPDQYRSTPSGWWVAKTPRRRRTAATHPRHVHEISINALATSGRSPGSVQVGGVTIRSYRRSRTREVGPGRRHGVFACGG